MTVSGPDRVSRNRLTFGTPLRLKLKFGHRLITPCYPHPPAGILAAPWPTRARDNSSLPGFSSIGRSYLFPNPTKQFDFTCQVQINGFELMSSKFVQSMEFTSSPAQPGMYATREVIEATATLSEAVTVDGPPPVLRLQVGDNEREMAYAASASTATSWVSVTR